MKKYYTKIIYTFTIIAIAIFFGCGSSQESMSVCNCEQRKNLQQFIKESIKPSNNMSDEEMEDVIRQLRIEGINIFCEKKPIWIKYDGQIDWLKQKSDSCQSIMQSW